MLVAVATPCAAETDSLERFLAAIPTSADEFSPERAAALAKLAPAADEWFADAADIPEDATAAARLAVAERLIAAMQTLDTARQQALSLRTRFASQPAGPLRRVKLAGYVGTLNVLLGLIARANYTSISAIDAVGVDLTEDPRSLAKLSERLAAADCRIGAVAIAPLLLDRDPDTATKPLLSADGQLTVLRSIAATKPAAALGVLAEYIQMPDAPPYLVVLAAETIRRVGLPQDPPSDADPTLPKPEITAAELHSRLSGIDVRTLDAKHVALRKELLAWLDRRRKQGVTGDEALLIDGQEIRPGDWMLMRNPSPYNRFSDLSPGLFTHVGVVAATTGNDGVRRIVVVDLPERGTQLPATPVDTFVKRTLNYAFLRHDDPAIAQKMADVAASIVGNPSQFDLNFRIDRVDQLRGQPLAGKKITTYCAGLLWLCAQETGRPREEFFPIPEKAAGGNTLANLAKLGISIGDDFVSPTGPLFSPRMSVAVRRAPMYSPESEIEQAVFDRFALGLHERDLSPSLDQYQTLRLKLAEAAKKNDLLAKALAKANNVSEDMDLVSAAKAAAVVETLDEAAFGASAAFGQAFDAIVVEDDETRPLEPARREAIDAARKTHADLYRRWLDYRLSSRELRQALVHYYTDQGRRQLDERFFSGSKR
ncbi:MAG: hypothetical protein WD875_11670 [Pirellulales bacterium]